MKTVKKTCVMVGLVAGVTFAPLSHADVGVTGDVGTTGIGFHAGVPLRPDLDLRFGTGYFAYSYKGSTADLNYDLKLKANTYDVLLDWFPDQNSPFRVTAGLAYNANKIDVRARSNLAGSYTLQGNTYNAASVGDVTGKVDFRKVAPYLGIGWGKAQKKDKGWSFSTDIGVLFQGAPKTALSSTGCSAPAALCSQFANDIARENAALSDEVRKFKAYPVLRIGISYQF